MTGPFDPAVIDDAIQRYLAGESHKQILATTGIRRTVLYRERTARGIPPRRVQVYALPVAEIAVAYAAGESEYSLSLRYGVSRAVIRRHLEGNGVDVRSMSAAGKVRAGKMTAEEREAQAAAAHAALRGAKQSMEQLVNRSAAMERIGKFASPGERQFHGWLADRGLHPMPQKAIGKYNVDVAVAPVAVEILGGGWHLEKRHHATRTPEILDAGWHLVFCWNREGPGALTEGAADYVVAFLDEIRREPPAIGQYRVITGDGKLLATRSRDDSEFPLVKPPRGRDALRS